MGYLRVRVRLRFDTARAPAHPVVRGVLARGSAKIDSRFGRLRVCTLGAPHNEAEGMCHRHFLAAKPGWRVFASRHIVKHILFRVPHCCRLFRPTKRCSSRRSALPRSIHSNTVCSDQLFLFYAATPTPASLFIVSHTQAKTRSGQRRLIMILPEAPSRARAGVSSVLHPKAVLFLVFVVSCATGSLASGPFPDNFALQDAVNACLDQVDTGLNCCSLHGDAAADTGICGVARQTDMPDWDTSLVTSMQQLFYRGISSISPSESGTRVR